MPTAEAPAPARPPLTGPAPWVGLVGDDQEGASAPEPFPGKHWPKLETIDYVSKLIMLIILLLAFPWLIGKLLTRPGEISAHSAGMAMGPTSMGA